MKQKHTTASAAAPHRAAQMQGSFGPTARVGVFGVNAHFLSQMFRVKPN